MVPQIMAASFRLAGLETAIDLMQDFGPAIDSLKEKLFSCLSIVDGKLASDRFIAYWYYAFDPSDSNKEPEVRYFAGVELTDTNGLPPDFVVKCLPESTYAVFRENQRGEAAGPEGYAYRQWLPQSEYRLDDRISGDLEVYESRADTTPQTPCDIYIPVVAAKR